VKIADSLRRVVMDSVLSERLKRKVIHVVNRLYDWSIAGEQLYAVHARLASTVK